MKLGFRATAAMPTYRVAVNKVIKDGEVTEFPKERATGMLKDFPLNWFTAGDLDKQLETEAEEAATAEEKAKTALPSGHPEKAGDTTGVDLDGLSNKESALYKEAARKVDGNEELTDAEADILTKVEEAANAS